MRQNIRNSHSSENELTFPTRPFPSFGGVRLPHIKGTEKMETELLPLPERVVISMQQHVGAPCEPVVKPGDHVDVGQVIGDSDAYVSAPIHASVSGTVSAISELLLPSGQKAKAVVIDADGKQTMWSGIKPPRVKNAADLCAAVRASGLVGLGGAGFPAHVKLNIPKGKSVDTLIINGAECEPYLTADYREMVECGDMVLEGIYTLKELLGIKRVIIGVESNKPDAIRILTDIADGNDRDPDDEVRVLKLATSYPQGAEKVLINCCTGRRVPKGKLPVDVGCIVMNITSVSFIAKYLRDGVPLINKRLTVDGSAVVQSMNVMVPVGTPISDIIEFCEGYRTEPRKILMGGPMMGIAVFDDSTPILKQNNGLLVLSARDVIEDDATDCIRCGRCVSACPMQLQPLTIEKRVAMRDIEALERHSIMTCIECGSCAFVCPARRKLVQYMRMGKTLLRKAGEKK